MKCKSCGANIRVGAPSCPNCGKATLDATVWQRTEKQRSAKSVQPAAASVKKNDAAFEVSLVVAFEGVLASFVGMFLPFFEIRVFGAVASIPLWSGKFIGEAIVLAVAMVIGLVCAIAFQNGKGFPLVVTGATVLSITLFDMFYNIKSLEKENLNSIVGKGSGFYLLVIGGILLVNSGMILNVLRTRGTRKY